MERAALSENRLLPVRPGVYAKVTAVYGAYIEPARKIADVTINGPCLYLTLAGTDRGDVQVDQAHVRLWADELLILDDPAIQELLKEGDGHV